MSTRSMPRPYYGWVLVATLGVTATVSYGILSYGFAAFIAPMSDELGWTKTQITGAFSIAQLTAGAAAVPIGRWMDRHGARAMMTAGSVLAALLLAAWSQAHTLPAYYAIWAAMGVAMAAVLYEPAFAVVTVWFRRDRSRALTLLTFLGGFASVIFVPLVTFLVARQGWRDALLTLAVLQLALTGLPHALLLRRRPEDLGLAVDGDSSDHASEPSSDSRLAPPGTHAVSQAESARHAREVVRGAPFRWTALAFTLAGMTSTAVTVHLVPLLVERGHDVAFAGGVMGILGLMALPGRLVFTPLGAWLPRAHVTASIFALQVVAVLVLLSSRSTAAVWVFAALFGAGFGAITPARAALVGDIVHPSAYGRVSGVLALLLSLARAAAPVGASVLYAAAGGVDGGYDAMLAVLLALGVASGAAVMLAAPRAGRMPVPARQAA